MYAQAVSTNLPASFPMLKSYFKVAFRNLKRRPGYTLTNVFGLAVGMAACLMIGLYVRYELGYDDFHEKGERIYRVDQPVEDLPTSAGAFVEMETASMLKEAIPEIQQTVRIKSGPETIRRGGKVFNDVEGKYVSSGFFEIFSFDLVAGDPAALERPGTVILTQPMVDKLFGDADALGQSISAEVYGRPTTLEVAGVVERVPANSHFTFDFLVSLETMQGAMSLPDFHAKELWTYVLLAEGTQPAQLQAELQNVAENIPGVESGMALLPLTDLYLHHWAPRQGDPRYLYILGAVAAVILLIAGANYTSLATARATQRAREVGVRKVVGARREQLAGQFLGESVLVSLLALPVALGLLALALPFFNAVAGTDLTFRLAEQTDTLLLLAAGAVIVGLVAGAYPALFLSRFRPAEVLRERLPSGFSGARLRKGLTVFQFTLSAALLFSVAVIVQQLRYVQTVNLGFDEERVVALPLQSEALEDQAPALKQELQRLPHVQRATLASDLPGTEGVGGSEFEWKGETVSLDELVVDPDFIETLDLNLVAGRGFSAARPADSSAFVLNEAAAQALGWATPKEAIGEQISFFGDTWRIVGVVEDFHYQSLHQEIAPLAMQLAPYKRVAAFRIAGGQVPATLKAVQKTWAQFTEMPFTYQFLDERINQLYRQEQQTAQVLGGFAGLALLLACLGLFALATYAVERRTKEISIRKVMGASVTNIVTLLSKDFLKLLGIALVIAAPLAWFAMRRWLEGFAYHVSLGPGLFLLVGAGVLVVAFLTVGAQAVRAALANPAEHLRNE